MQIRTIGGEDPKVAVLGALHDDEPCGASAIEECLTTDPSLEPPTAFIIANDRALERNQRYIDVDLNWVLPGDLTSQEYERRLAADLVSSTVGCETLGTHSTPSYSGVFSVLSDPNDRKRTIFDRMALTNVADMSRTVQISLFCAQASAHSQFSTVSGLVFEKLL